MHVKGTQRKQKMNPSNEKNNENQYPIPIQNNQHNQNLTFLEIIQNFKKEIFEQLECKLANLVHFQSQNQINPIHLPPQYQTNTQLPVRPTTFTQPRITNQTQQFPVQPIRPMQPVHRPPY